MGSGPTDPAEAHFDKGSWGYDGTQWRKLPMIWGYSDTYREAIYTPDVDAGDEVVVFGTVPAGEVWVITQMLAYCGQLNTTRVEFVVNLDGVEVNLKRAVPTAVQISIDWQGMVVMNAGDNASQVFRACVAGDDFWSQVVGYKMDVAL